MKDKEVAGNLKIVGPFYPLIIVFTILLIAACVPVVDKVRDHGLTARPNEYAIVSSAFTGNPQATSSQSYSALREGKRTRVNKGIMLPIQSYVSPGDEVIKSLAENITSIEEAYETAVRWVCVSEQRLNQEINRWLTPHQFLVDTRDYSGNPIPGEVVSDCEEQAYTLVSLIRAITVDPQNVRVALGEVQLGNGTEGHAWVEVLIDDDWLVLEPTSGPYWDDMAEKLVSREGVSFKYYRNYPYPVTQVWIYFNDVYYFNFKSESGNAPTSWL